MGEQPGATERGDDRDGKAEVDTVPARVDRADESDRRVEQIAEHWIGVAVNDVPRHVAVGQRAVKEPGGTFHHGVEDVDGLGRAHADHQEHEAEREEQQP